MQKQSYEIGFRLTREQREKIEAKGFYVYATRSWDRGCGCTLEKRVIVNHETDVILNFKPEEIEPNVVTYDYFQWCEDNDVEYGSIPFEEVEEIINENL